MIEAKRDRISSIHRRAWGQQAVHEDEGKPAERHPLNRAEEHELAKRVQNGERRALESLVMANIGRVISLARRYASFGLPMKDLISEGMLGLVEAAQSFDPYRGTRFYTYAVWPLKRSMIKALVEQRGVVGLPYHKSSLLFRIQQAYRDLAQKKGLPVSLREVADEVGITEDQVNEISYAGGSYVSLDAPLPGESSDDFYALCENEQSPDPALILQSSEDHKRIHAALENLPDREQVIIKLHYGLNGGDCMTFAEIGRMIGLSRQRVQQLENRAFCRLRSSLEIYSVESSR